MKRADDAPGRKPNQAAAVRRWLQGEGYRSSRPAPVASDRFDREWLRQEEWGKVDALGAAEYRRVKSDWIAAGRPKTLEDFIPGSGGE